MHSTQRSTPLTCMLSTLLIRFITTLGPYDCREIIARPLRLELVADRTKPRGGSGLGCDPALARDLDQVAARVIEHGGGDRGISSGSCVNRTPSARSRSYSALTSSTANDV